MAICLLCQPPMKMPDETLIAHMREVHKAPVEEPFHWTDDGEPKWADDEEPQAA